MKNFGLCQFGSIPLLEVNGTVLSEINGIVLFEENAISRQGHECVHGRRRKLLATR